jgi:hypothetical protein
MLLQGRELLRPILAVVTAQPIAGRLERVGACFRRAE